MLSGWNLEVIPKDGFVIISLMTWDLPEPLEAAKSKRNDFSPPNISFFLGWNLDYASAFYFTVSII